MILRRQLAVSSPISPLAIARAFVATLFSAPDSPSIARDLVRDRYDARSVILADSGTSALVHALRLAVPPGGVVGFPGYACVDLAAAARFAGVRVRLYDIDPSSLSPDLDSVERLLHRGVDAIVVAHLFAYPADVPSVRTLSARAGVTVIEDAAQGAGGQLDGRRLGSLGDLAALSFGRGKGLCAGGGGALLGFGGRWAGIEGDVRLQAPPRGWSGLASTAVQWGLGRPALYAIPSMLPWLHLGEMVYHPAGEPTNLSLASSSLLASAFSLETGDLHHRRRIAAALDRALAGAEQIGAISPIAGAESGYLRYALRDTSGRRAVDPRRGIMQPYPRTLAEQSELAPILMADEPPIPGATELRRSLFTLPTHQFVNDNDLAALIRWADASGMRRLAS